MLSLQLVEEGIVFHLPYLTRNLSLCFSRAETDLSHAEIDLSHYKFSLWLAVSFSLSVLSFFYFLAS